MRREVSKMDEETKSEEKPASEGSGEGVQFETISELDRADQIAERQKRENDRREAILQREEALAARRAVGGVTDGAAQEKPKELSPAEYARKAMAGEIDGR
jgi:uncharacterized protein (DUF3084 family)